MQKAPLDLLVIMWTRWLTRGNQHVTWQRSEDTWRWSDSSSRRTLTSTSWLMTCPVLYMQVRQLNTHLSLNMSVSLMSIQTSLLCGSPVCHQPWTTGTRRLWSCWSGKEHRSTGYTRRPGGPVYIKLFTRQFIRFTENWFLVIPSPGIFDEEFSSLLRVTATSFVFLLTFATSRPTMTTRFRRCSWQHSTDRRSAWSSLLMLVSISACSLFIFDWGRVQADDVFCSLTSTDLTELTEIISRQQLNKEHLFPTIFFLLLLKVVFNERA